MRLLSLMRRTLSQPSQSHLVVVKRKKRRKPRTCLERLFPDPKKKRKLAKWEKRWAKHKDRYADMLKGTRFVPTDLSLGHGAVAGPATVPPLARTLGKSWRSGQLVARFWEELKRYEPWYHCLCIWLPHFPRERRLLLILPRTALLPAGLVALPLPPALLTCGLGMVGVVGTVNRCFWRVGVRATGGGSTSLVEKRDGTRARNSSVTSFS